MRASSGSSSSVKYSFGCLGCPLAFNASKYSLGRPARPGFVKASQSSVLPLRGVAHRRYEQVGDTSTSSVDNEMNRQRTFPERLPRPFAALTNHTIDYSFFQVI